MMHMLYQYYLRDVLMEMLILLGRRWVKSGRRGGRILLTGHCTLKYAFEIFQVFNGFPIYCINLDEAVLCTLFCPANPTPT